MTNLERSTITGAVLAGGEGRRMGGVDKGLVELNGKPLIRWVLEALRPQVGALLINANRSLDRYRALGWPVVSDSSDDYQGPLAGMLAMLSAAETDFVLTVPCDAPHIPPDLAQRLGTALLDANAEIAVAYANGRRQSVHTLMRRELCRPLADCITTGERKIARWQDSRRCVEVPCDDIVDAFVNVNTPEERDQLERKHS